MRQRRKIIKALDLAAKVKAAIEDKKGEETLIVNVAEISGVTDYYIVTSGSSSPHLKAIFGSIQQELKKDGVYAYRKTGDPEGGWMVLDYLDVIIHIFSREARDYYSIEELWESAPKVDL